MSAFVMVMLVVRIAFIGDAGSDAALGARMAIEEATRAAALLGARIELVHVAAGASAAVVADTTSVTDIPVIALAELHGNNVFRVLPADTAGCIVWDASLEKFGAAQLNDRFRAMYHRDMTPAAWAGWFGVKVLWESALRAHSGKPAEILAFLQSDRAMFDGHKGELLRFDAQTRRLRRQWYAPEQSRSYPCSR